ncbi:MAG: DNA polymerase III subunit delta' [Bacteroidetes bacterium]|jgi:DNA polymerase-3 subunit delta'|nr:DNA polymerase III subunit delta' [Bacteroidota bacterium]
MQFKDVVGQQEIKQLLLKMAGSGRIAHAMLFLGQTGSGTLPLAVAFAQYLNCENPLADDSCGQCTSCRQYEQLAHPDLHFVVPVNSTDEVKKPRTDDFIAQWRQSFTANPYLTLNDWYQAIGIEKKQGIIAAEESAGITHKLFLKSFTGRYKILIMWHAEKMNAATSNKLLKIIEEPPDDSVFILTTDRYDGILPTILSRTQMVKVPIPDTETLVNFLKTEKNIEVNHARSMARLAGNDISETLQLLRNDNRQEQPEQVFLSWLRMCWNISKDYKKLYSWVEEMARLSRDEQRNFLVFGISTARECLIANLAGPQHARYNEQTFAGFERFSKMITPQNIESFSKTLQEGAFHIERNANAKILFLDLSFRMHHILRM